MAVSNVLSITTVALLNSAGVINQAFTATGSAAVSVSEDIAADGSTNVTCAIDVSALKVIALLATGADLVITSGADTVNLTAGIPIYWTPDLDADCPFAADTTVLAVANGHATAAAVLTIAAVLDATP